MNRESTEVELVRADAPDAGKAPRRGPMRSMTQTFLRPLRRFFDWRFQAVQDILAAHISAEAHDTRAHLSALTSDQHQVELREEAARIDDLRRYVAAGRDANIDAATFVGEVLRDLEEQLAQLNDAVRAGGEVALPSGGKLEELDTELARFLNSAVGHQGYAAQRGLWLNWPVTVSYEEGTVRLGSVNERIVEHPYVLRATAGLARGSRVLDVGAAESTLALSLAGLGFAVVALDPRGYPLAHPNLRPETTALEDWETDQRFDAVLCVSTIEHLGVGEYGESRQPSGADERALAKMLELLEPDGMLALTAPLGGEGYERERLEELLADWKIDDFTVAEQSAPAQWSVGERGSAEAAVALVTARRPS
jgi:SAM-dependent methyltransferase